MIVCCNWWKWPLWSFQSYAVITFTCPWHLFCKINCCSNTRTCLLSPILLPLHFHFICSHQTSITADIIGSFHGNFFFQNISIVSWHGVCVTSHSSEYICDGVIELSTCLSTQGICVTWDRIVYIYSEAWVDQCRRRSVVYNVHSEGWVWQDIG